LRLFMPSMVHFWLMAASTIGGVIYLLSTFFRNIKNEASSLSRCTLLYQLAFFILWLSGAIAETNVSEFVYFLGLAIGILLGAIAFLEEKKRSLFLALLTGSFAFIFSSLLAFLFVCS